MRRTCDVKVEPRIWYWDAKGHVQLYKLQSYWHRQLNICSSMDFFASWFGEYFMFSVVLVGCHNLPFGWLGTGIWLAWNWCLLPWIWEVHLISISSGMELGAGPVAGFTCSRCKVSPWFFLLLWYQALTFGSAGTGGRKRKNIAC